MDREDFMDIVYSELHSDGDNNRANRIIDAADEYAESVQLGTDLISRQQAIDAVKAKRLWHGQYLTNSTAGYDYAIEVLKELPSAQPERHIDEWCTDCKEYDKEKHCCPRWNRVIKNTVDELKSVQPEPCEDAVSRKDCLKALSNMMDTDGFRNGWAVSRANVECMLKSMPSVTLKQRIGYWIKITNTLYKCDRCGAVQLKGNYCKDCGAKMEGVNNEND